MKNSEEIAEIIEEEGVAMTLSSVGSPDKPQWMATIMIGDTTWAKIVKEDREVTLSVAQHRLDAFMSAVYPPKPMMSLQDAMMMGPE